jgi:hypothetical protein
MGREGLGRRRPPRLYRPGEISGPRSGPSDPREYFARTARMPDPGPGGPFLGRSPPVLWRNSGGVLSVAGMVGWLPGPCDGGIWAGYSRTDGRDAHVRPPPWWGRVSVGGTLSIHIPWRLGVTVVARLDLLPRREAHGLVLPTTLYHGSSMLSLPMPISMSRHKLSQLREG